MVPLPHIVCVTLCQVKTHMWNRDEFHLFFWIICTEIFFDSCLVMVLIALMLLLLFFVGGCFFFSYHNYVFICTSGFGACLVVVLTALAFLLLLLASFSRNCTTSESKFCFSLDMVLTKPLRSFVFFIIYSVFCLFVF